MLRHLAIASLIYVALVLQPGLPVELSMAGARPWIPGMALVLCLMLAEGSASLIWVSILGLGVDCLSGERLGVHIVVATAVAAGLQVFQSSSRFVRPAAVSIAVLTGTFFWKFAVTALHALLAHRTLDWPSVATAASGDAVYTAVLVLLVLIVSRAAWASIFPERLAQFSILNRWSRLTSD